MKSRILIPASALKFLEQVKKNNNRDWFAKHKAEFEREQKHIELFADALLKELSQHDLIETASGKKALHRIYRDTRFSKDKTPYKSNWSGSFTRATKQRRGGMYFHIEPGKSFVGGGFWGPNPADLKRIRDEIAFDAAPLRKILKSKNFVSTFGTLQGEQIKTTPKGFDPENEGIDLLRYKQFVIRRHFSDKEVLSENFLKEVNQTFKYMCPFFDYMSEVLTSDVNGMALD
jgi:uncharacterized protein (TIGR02453 family)